MDAKGISFHYTENSKLQAEKLFKKNGFEYFVLQHKNFNELYILPNKNLEILIEKIVSKINHCSTESEIIDLVFDKMN